MNSFSFSTGVLALGSLIVSTSGYALSPPNLIADIPWEAPGLAVNSVEATEAAYNNGRRQEEIQLGVASNALGTMDLPDQTVWDVMTPAEKALMITNSERSARDGVAYPNHGTVLGLPLEAVESHLNKLAQDYAEYMVENNFWDHVVPAVITEPPFASSNSSSRINGHPIIGDSVGATGTDCYQFMARAENLALSGYSQSGQAMPVTFVETSIYSFLYDDSSSNWGHREAQLLQDVTLSGQPWGFDNDRGSPASEGFMGIGIAGRGDGSYSIFNGTTYPSQYALVWLVMDPSADTDCNYGVPVTKDLSNNAWHMITIPATPPTGGNTVADIFGDDITGAYTQSWIIWEFDESIGRTGGYVDPGIDGVLQSGKGYWILQQTGATVTIDMPVGSTAASVVSDPICAAPSPTACFSYALSSRATPQPNMLGNPFYTRPSIDNLRVSTSTGVCSTTGGCNMTQASDQAGVNVQDSEFWHWDGTSYNTALSTGDQMQPWDAYWNFVLPGAFGADPTLHIPRN